MAADVQGPPFGALALDVSATTWGWAAVRPGEPEVVSGTMDLVERGVIRLAEARRGLHRLVRHTTPGVVVLEGYSYGSRNASHLLGEVGGVVRLALHDLAIPWTEASPAQRMILAKGKGQASKEAVLAEAVRRLGYQGESPDEADALWLLELVRQAWRFPGRAKLPALHLRALDRMTWPEIAAYAGPRGLG